MLQEIKKNIYFLNAVDWNRRLFDSLIPLPDGTSYNAYLIKGSEKTVLIDTADPSFEDSLMEQLKEVKKLDYIISLHTEQDHSGLIPHVLQKYPEAKVIASPKAKDFLMELLFVSEDKIITVADNEELQLGDKTLQFIHFPWVHWPETMLAYLKEDKIMFTCDFLGSHLATADMFLKDECQGYESAKRYFAEIMMPFRTIIKKNMPKLENFDIQIVAPSHGPMYNRPEFIIDAYKDWVSDNVKNEVVIPYISMHGSVEKMVQYLVQALKQRGVKVSIFDLTAADIGKLAINLVDAATIIVGTPTFSAEAHPLVSYAVKLVNALRPKTKFASVIASYAWGGKAIDSIVEMLPNLKVELLPTVLAKGAPKDADFKALDQLADAIALKHKDL